MPDPSIHPDHVERIERECAEARGRARMERIYSERTSVEYWTHVNGGSARSTDAYVSENIRLHTLMLAALVADGES